MRLLTLIVLAVAALGAATSTSAGSGPTSLKVTYWEDGATAVPTEVWTIRCNPVGGTLRRPARACRKLAAGGAKLFAPVPPNAVCTQIWGGPQTARVTGRVSGKYIRTTFSRTDGCQIARWNALAPWLLPPGGATR